MQIATHLTARAQIGRSGRKAVAESRASSELLVASGAIALAFLTLSVGIGLAAVAGPAGLATLAVAMIAICYLSPTTGLALILVSTFFQSIVIAIFAPYLEGQNQFQAMQGANFVISVAGGLFAATSIYQNWGKLEARTRRIVTLAAAFMFIVLAYALIGLMKASFTSVAIYLRIYWMGCANLAIGLALGAFVRRSVLSLLIVCCGFLLSAYCLLEFFIPLDLYDFFGVPDFLSWKYYLSNEFKDGADVVSHNTGAWLNLSGDYSLDFRMPRLLGPNLHPIGFGYGLAFCGLVAFAAGHRLLGGLAGLLTIVVGAKGAIALYVLSLSIWFVTKRRRFDARTRVVALTGIGTYILLFALYGLATRDYHYLGLMGGIVGFLGNPLGHGVGIGGNLSDLARSGELDWSVFMANGLASFGLESAIGVLLYQLGFLGVVLAPLWIRIVNRLAQSLPATDLCGSQSAKLIPIAMMVLLGSAAFQEEVLSPSGWGLWMLVAGAYIAQPGRARRRISVPGR